MALPLRPSRGGFVRPFGCGWFIREFLLGHGPNGSLVIDPDIGSPQAEIFYHYKRALIRAIAEDRATKEEEKQARRDKRAISPDRIEKLAGRYLARIPYKTTSCRYHSFITYFSNLQRLRWVGKSGSEEPSAFQDNYSRGQPRKYFRITLAGRAASEAAWANPFAALYGWR